MKKLEARENEFVTQLKSTIRSTFPLVLGVKIDYYLGEDDKGERGLYFELFSKYGKLFSRSQALHAGQVVYDIEEEFINQLINEFVMMGINFLNIMGFESVSPARVEREITAQPFNHTSPRKMIFVN